MNFKELLEKLNNLNVSPKYYGILGNLKDDAYIIERLSNGKYKVYYSERNEQCEVKIFENESDACKELLSRIEFNLSNGLDLSVKQHPITHSIH